MSRSHFAVITDHAIGHYEGRTVIEFIREFLLQFGLFGGLAWMLLKILVVMMPLMPLMLLIAA